MLLTAQCEILEVLGYVHDHSTKFELAGFLSSDLNCRNNVLAMQTNAANHDRLHKSVGVNSKLKTRLLRLFAINKIQINA